MPEGGQITTKGGIAQLYPYNEKRETSFDSEHAHDDFDFPITLNLGDSEYNVVIRYSEQNQMAKDALLPVKKMLY